MVLVKSLMRKPVFLYPDDDLKKISSKLRRSDVDVFVVINKKGKFLGEIHEMDLLSAVIPERNLSSEEVIGILGFGIKKKFFGKKIFLEVFIKVKKNWRNDPSSLKKFGYNI